MPSLWSVGWNYLSNPNVAVWKWISNISTLYNGWNYLSVLVKGDPFFLTGTHITVNWLPTQYIKWYSFWWVRIKKSNPVTNLLKLFSLEWSNIGVKASRHLDRLAKRKHLNSIYLLVLCEGHPSVTGESPHKGPVMRKACPGHDDIIVCFASLYRITL